MTRDEYRLRAREIARRGVELPQAKLCADKVRVIRTNPAGMTRQQRADRFGVHINTIDKVLTYRSWVHV
jgi:hypothetical protein